MLCLYRQAKLHPEEAHGKLQNYQGTKKKGAEIPTEIPIAAHCSSTFFKSDPVFYKIFPAFRGLGKVRKTVTNDTTHSCTGKSVQRDCSVTLT